MLARLFIFICVLHCCSHNNAVAFSKRCRCCMQQLLRRASLRGGAGAGGWGKVIRRHSESTPGERTTTTAPPTSCATAWELAFVSAAQVFWGTMQVFWCSASVQLDVCQGLSDTVPN